MRLILWCCVLALCSCQQQSQAAEPEVATPPSAASSACGAKGQPDCSLQGWMKSTMQPYQHDKEFARLATSFDKLAQYTPDGYGNWRQIAETGAAAARAQDETAVSKSCKACHNEHRSKFRKERRSVPLF